MSVRLQDLNLRGSMKCFELCDPAQRLTHRKRIQKSDAATAIFSATTEKLQ